MGLGVISLGAALRVHPKMAAPICEVSQRRLAKKDAFCGEEQSAANGGW
jgi:hypothetical protein